MINVELLLAHFCDHLESLQWILSLNVSGKRVFPSRDGPDVQVVNLLDTLDFHEFLLHLFSIELLGGSLHEHVQALLDSGEGLLHYDH